MPTSGTGGSSGTGGTAGTAGTGGASTPEPQQIAEAILGFEIDNFGAFTLAAPTGVETCNSNLDIDKRIPAGCEETFQTGVIVAELSQSQLENAFTGNSPALPIGTGDIGLTLEAENAISMEPGIYLVTWQCTEDPVPLSDPVRLSQRAYVADRDRQILNNYRGQTPFEGDYFDNTDLWFSAEYSPTEGWVLRVTDALNGNLMSIGSAARVTMAGRAQVFVIPVDELGGSSSIGGRYTAFTHEGDFGQQGGYWSGDTTPRVDEPLRVVPVLELDF